MKVAIPRHGGRVAPRFASSATITIYTIRNHRIADRVDFTLQSQHGFDRVRLLRDQAVDTLICGGVETFFERILQASGIHTISWVTGTVDELLDQFLAGTLVAGSGRLGQTKPTPKQ